MRRFNMYFVLIALLFLYTSICAITYVNAVGSSISSEVFRLHVIANSDSEEDQNLKYIVRDNVLKYVNSKDIQTKKELVEYLNSHLTEIETIAKETVKANGYDYNVTAEIGNFNFPTKEYGDIAFPAGDYDALRIKIGDYAGKNWWCVMFPPLCFVDLTTGIVDESAKEMLEENLTEEEYALVSESDVQIKFKFKLFELFNNFQMILANK